MNDCAKNTGPLVSVIIPCYNQGRFLGEAIKSVLCQTWRPLEIIVVNDGSTDETADILARHSGLIAIHQRNAGLAAARNAGLHIARGDYVLFLDADDLLLPGAVRLGIREMLGHPECAFVWGGYRETDEKAVPIGEPIMSTNESDQYLAILSGQMSIIPACVLYRRDVFEIVGKFDPTVPINEDFDMNLRIAARFPVRSYSEPIAYYRQHDANMTLNTRLDIQTHREVVDRQFRRDSNRMRQQYNHRAIRLFWDDIYCRRLVRDSLKQLRAPETIGTGIEGLIHVIAKMPWQFCKSTAKYFVRHAGRIDLRTR